MFKSKKKIKIYLQYWRDGKCLIGWTLTVSPNETIYNVKKEFAKSIFPQYSDKDKCVQRISIVKKGTNDWLDNSKTLKYYGYGNNTCLTYYAE